MLERMGEFTPDKESHRLSIGFVLALVGVLALGDGLNVIWFPLYTLGLPGGPAANTVVVLFGVALFAVSYSLVRSVIDDGAADEAAASAAALADGGDDTNRDPVELLEVRYARGEIDDAEYERRLEHLDGDSGGADPADRQTTIAERDGLADRQTTIE